MDEKSVVEKICDGYYNVPNVHPPKGANKDEVSAYRKGYILEQSRTHEVLRADLESENGVAHWPQTLLKTVWDLAWTRGHSDGLKNVALYYEEYLDLAKAAYEAGQNSV